MDTTTSALAHLRPDGTPHHLEDHLQSVAALAAGFAAGFGADWAFLAGLWHDLGKYRPAFQRYIRAVNGVEAHVETAREGGGNGRVDHSSAGALHAIDRFGIRGRVLAYLIAGHHCGLDNWHDGLAPRLAKPDKREALAQARAMLPDAGLLAGELPRSGVPGAGEPGSFALWLRMLFSCLVDADFLDTEAFLQPQRTDARSGYPALTALLPAFDAFMAARQAGAAPGPVNALRAEVLAACRAAAVQEAGLYTLDAPTGGGKTLASMAFALEHARHHGRQRVIHVIPYTSIIEQTADVFRSIFPDAVVEHHSSVEVAPGHEDARSRLACENWDAPVIVTTTVQFFESLFADRPGRCRKLHRIADSIVVLDEAQLLPVALLQPILDVLRLLTRHYGVSVVLATATQPALATQQWFGGRLRGLDTARPIVPDAGALHRRLDRVRYEWPADYTLRRTWSNLAAELAGLDTVLTIVNRRADAAELFRLLPAEGRIHLSALMCGAHRARVIADVRVRLATGTGRGPLRVVSTQLVEAGVDLDFPVVYRALAGLDSIAQAAGRCNREGRLEQRGRVVVFVPPQAAPYGLLRRAEQITIGQMHGRAPARLEPAEFGAFFGRLYRELPLDAKDVCAMLEPGRAHLDLRFRDAAEAFRLIDNEESGYRTIHVRYRPDGCDDIDRWLAMLERDGPARWLLRRLQRYAVSLPGWHFGQLQDRGDLDEPRPGFFVLRDGLYDTDLGVPLGERANDPESLVL